MNDTKTMGNPSSVKPKQFDSQLNGTTRKLFNQTAKDSGGSVSSRSKHANSSKPTGNQCSKSVTANSSTTSSITGSTAFPTTSWTTGSTAHSAAHSIVGSSVHSNLSSNATAILCSSNVPSSFHSTIVPSTSKPSIGADSRKSNRMASVSHRTGGHYAASLASRPSNHSISNRTLNQTTNHNSNHSSMTAGQPAIHQCKLCEQHFDDIRLLNSHLINTHKVDKRITGLQCYVNGCEEKFRRRMELVGHLNDVHHLGVVVLRKTVASLEEFERWKGELERSSGCTWTENNKLALKNQLRITYICDRPATNGIKLYSLHGQTTINNKSTFCLSSIKVTEENGNFLIEFIETHNHDE